MIQYTDDNDGMTLSVNKNDGINGQTWCLRFHNSYLTDRMVYICPSDQREAVYAWKKGDAMGENFTSYAMSLAYNYANVKTGAAIKYPSSVMMFVDADGKFFLNDTAAAAKFDIYTCKDLNYFGWRHGGMKRVNVSMIDGHVMDSEFVYHDGSNNNFKAPFIWE